MRTETASGHRRAAFIGPAGGCVRVSRDSKYSEVQDAAIRACYNRIHFTCRDRRPRHWYPIPAGQGKDPQEGKKDKEA